MKLKGIINNKIDGILSFCSVCGSDEFAHADVLWQDLIDSWQLSNEEINYINRQQGFYCNSCGNNLRAIALAKAIVITYSDYRTLSEFCDSGPHIRVLEINKAGNLTSTLQKLPYHSLVEYPQYDLSNLKLQSEGFDLVIHSDTLEHVPNPERALSECRRVLRANGKCIFTVPIIVERLSRSRAGLAPSFHGQSGVLADDQLVYTEFGADIWQTVLKAGFSSCEIFSLEFPAALAIIAKK